MSLSRYAINGTVAISEQCWAVCWILNRDKERRKFILPEKNVNNECITTLWRATRAITRPIFLVSRIILY